ncbi:MFS transporter [Sporomusa sp.]|uniref:MFS transporter n=1 Tax=Sporomusa sp. TaxID=2078658 RepID=UPI002CD371ED|nr:MFS transporter [Sporomusa sp.]HWR06186.1 MFS transporter [Sporomusa sp.]
MEQLPEGTMNQKPTRQRHLLSFILLITLLIAFMDRVNISVLIADPQFINDLQLEGQPMKMGMLMTAFLFAYGACSFLLAPLGDYLGPRKAMLIAVFIWILSIVIGGLTSFFGLLIVSRILLGIGEGLHYPMQNTFVKNWFPVKERGRANMVWSMGITLAPVVSMPLVSAMVYYAGWRFSFFGLALIGLIPLVLLWFFTTDTPRQNKRVNSAELELIESGLATEKAVQGQLEQGTFKQNIAALSKNTSFWLLVLFMCCQTFVYFGVMTWLPVYLKNSRGFSWAEMGALASLPGVAGFFTKLVSGYVLDAFGRRAPVLLIAMIGLGTGIYTSVAATSNVMSAIFIALGMGFMSFGTPAAYTLLQDLVPGKIISTASGILVGLSNALSGFAPLAVGFVISATGHPESGIAFLSCAAALGAVSAFILLLRKH